MKKLLEKIKHDFLTDPLYYLLNAFSWILSCVLIGGAITALI